MSVLSGYGKYKRYVLTSTGYKLCSQWTSSNTVHFDDGKTAQTKVGAINGITDSLTATSSNVALSAKAGKNLQEQVTELDSPYFTVYKNNTANNSETGTIRNFTTYKEFVVVLYESNMGLFKSHYVPMVLMRDLGRTITFRDAWEYGNLQSGYTTVSINPSGDYDVTSIINASINADVIILAR